MDLYLQAANKFKMAKKWSAAGNAFAEAASLYQKNGSKLDAATNFVEAGNCYKKTDPNGRLSLQVTNIALNHRTQGYESNGRDIGL